MEADNGGLAEKGGGDVEVRTSKLIKRRSTQRVCIGVFLSSAFCAVRKRCVYKYVVDMEKPFAVSA
jgi:hypothetical protein